jgi:hypothetical protein
VEGGGYALRHVPEFAGGTERSHEKIRIVILLDKI